MKQITVESCYDCPIRTRNPNCKCSEPNKGYCHVKQWLFVPLDGTIHPDCPLPDQVEPDRDRIFREELEWRMPNGNKVSRYIADNDCRGIISFVKWLGEELLKPEGETK